jgi:hypothetical protein
VRQLARRIERHAQHAQQLFDELITGRVIDEFGIVSDICSVPSTAPETAARANRGSALRNRPDATPARMSRSRRGATPPSDSM